ncbi:hypothetical protein [Mesorhizobium sangaii]|uniref:Uncharacterized protein n=1 Tax=Mesorhizobium sangaii TaxID=505389 RepID=A0A841PV98_9HYPH|nr:hypothetical protein [Mesorhizobium sangaii]MBB6413982.1 hypothetical protein [Mesorhizobium sangaii]
MPNVNNPPICWEGNQRPPKEGVCTAAQSGLVIALCFIAARKSWLQGSSSQCGIVSEYFAYDVPPGFLR